MKIRAAVHLGLAVALLAGCGGEDPEPPAEERIQPRAAEPAAPEPDTAATPPAEETETTAEAASSAPETVAASSLGEEVYTVQVGAFARGENADDLAIRLEAEAFPVWDRETVVEGEELRRVRVGAVTEYREADRLARTLEERFGLPTWIAPVDPGDRLPARISEDTRRILEG